MKFGSIAHVGWDHTTDKGIICEGIKANRHLDYSKPKLIYLKALQNAVKTIISGLSDKNKNRKEIIEEFTAHWKFSVNQDKSILSFVEPQKDISELQLYTKNDSPWFAILHDQHNKKINPRYLLDKRILEKTRIEGKAFYIPIQSQILPPDPTSSIKKWWKSLLKHLPSQQLDELKRIARKKAAKKVWVLGSIELHDDKYGWFCMEFTNPNKEKIPIHPSSDLTNWHVKAFNVEFHNKIHIKPRGGATIFEDPRIAIVGCGSVGAEIAKQLVCSGVENIELVDYDQMEIANIYRHYLSSEYIGLLKSVALAKELSCKYPYLNITHSKYSRLEQCLDSSFLERVNGIIVATGSPTDERFFNEKLMRMKIRPWVIYSWVEGHGFGGHAIYVHNVGKGCLNCLYRDGSGNKSLESIQNFLKTEQNIAIDLSGCGSHFLPYSYADAIQSALLATRLTTQALNGEIHKSCRISWKSSFSTNNTLETSYRYQNFVNSLNPEDLLWENCDVCN